VSFFPVTISRRHWGSTALGHAEHAAAVVAVVSTAGAALAERPTTYTLDAGKTNNLVDLQRLWGNGPRMRE
jgi:hypothetical protein